MSKQRVKKSCIEGQGAFAGPIARKRVGNCQQDYPINQSVVNQSVLHVKEEWLSHIYYLSSAHSYYYDIKTRFIHVHHHRNPSANLNNSLLLKLFKYITNVPE